jgi:hypothetical protein
MSQPDPAESTDPTWREVRPVLDDTLHELEEADRAAIILRFFEDLNFRQVGEELGLTENAARMRVDRALGKLQELLLKRGITSTGSALAAALVAGAAVVAPASLAASTTANALEKSAHGQGIAAKTVSSHWGARKLILIGVSTAIAVGTLGSIHFIFSHHDFARQLHRWLMQW